MQYIKYLYTILGENPHNSLKQKWGDITYFIFLVNYLFLYNKIILLIKNQKNGT